MAAAERTGTGFHQLLDEVRALEHPRGRHGSVYDIGDFGLDRDERRAALRFDTERVDGG